MVCLIYQYYCGWLHTETVLTWRSWNIIQSAWRKTYIEKVRLGILDLLVSLLGMYQYNDNDLSIRDLSIYQLNFDMMYLVFLSYCNACVFCFSSIFRNEWPDTKVKISKYMIVVWKLPVYDLGSTWCLSWATMGTQALDQCSLAEPSATGLIVQQQIEVLLSLKSSTFLYCWLPHEAGKWYPQSIFCIVSDWY